MPREIRRNFADLLAICRRALPPDHRAAVRTREELAGLLRDTGRGAEAEALLAEPSAPTEAGG